MAERSGRAGAEPAARSAPAPAGARPRTWRTPLRLVLRFGPPILGIVVIGSAIVASIGGEISHARFALGIILIALGFSARLVPGR
ncbi:hypothetical protein [Methylobacterium soli]|uniref:Uncharacterized protein n=1 Tax=Methylobacterium soli TaxID=553447 RepID=A0A6L3T4C3_9HYPH|nr:hypothetical protein [Methylobacterium soli]KAB1081768.1 hypothetical protein F6X53_01330 [Methylobacterium soli]GJE46521.1 hypothetical protein AEGHOMDF_5727 [Methylobacterium soli]